VPVAKSQVVRWGRQNLVRIVCPSDPTEPLIWIVLATVGKKVLESMVSLKIVKDYDLNDGDGGSNSLGTF
jgi:hypothetical protein